MVGEPDSRGSSVVNTQRQITQQQVEEFLVSLRRLPMPADAFRALVELLIESDEHGNVYRNDYRQWLAWACCPSERRVSTALQQLEESGRISRISRRHVRVLKVPAAR
jgi:hypothetical protein